MSSARSVTVVQDGPAVQLSGELDAAGAAAVHTALSDLVGRGQDDVVVDVSGLDFVDSMGLGALLKAAVQLERQQRRLRLVGAQGAVLEVIEASGLTARLGVEG